MKSMASVVVLGALVVAGALGVCATATDARADGDDRGRHRLVLSFGGQQSQGMIQTVTQTATAVSGVFQYRVNIAAVGQDRKPIQCILFVANMGDAQMYKNAVLDERTGTVTCSVSHGTTTDPTTGTYVSINTVSPSAGDSVVIESR